MRTYKKRKNNTNQRTYKKTVKKSFRKTKTKKRNKTILKGGGIQGSDIHGPDSEFASSPSVNNPMSMGQQGVMSQGVGPFGMMHPDVGQFGVMRRGMGPPLPPSLPMRHFPPSSKTRGVRYTMKNKKQETDQNRGGDSGFFTHTELIVYLLEFKKQISDIIAQGNSDQPVSDRSSKVNDILDKLATQTTQVKGIGVTISREWKTIIKRVNRELKEFEAAKKELKELIASSKKRRKKPKHRHTDKSSGRSPRSEMSDPPMPAPPSSAPLDSVPAPPDSAPPDSTPAPPAPPSSAPPIPAPPMPAPPMSAQPMPAPPMSAHR